MERLFEGEIYELVLNNGNFVFPYCMEPLGNTVRIGYKMLGDDGRDVIDASKNIYLITKYGSNFKAASELTTNYVLARTTELSNGYLCVVSDIGNAYLLDSDGMPVWSGSLDYKGESPSDIAAYKNSLWACYQKAGVLIRFNLKTMREELRIGGKNSPFDKPVNIFISGDTAIISNTGSKKLISVNLESYVVEEKAEFTESVYSYIEHSGKSYVMLETGLYVID